jgi:hypothetical protein
MADKNSAENLFKLADEFINLANDMVTEQNKDLQDVGSALRYAAARFTAHETAYNSKDLAGERDEAVAWFLKQYSEMLEENFDQHIEHIAKQKADNH